MTKKLQKHVITINTQSNKVAPKDTTVGPGDEVEWHIVPPPRATPVEFYLWFVDKNQPMNNRRGPSRDGKLADVVKGNASKGTYVYKVILETQDRVVDPHIIVD